MQNKHFGLFTHALSCAPICVSALLSPSVMASGAEEDVEHARVAGGVRLGREGEEGAAPSQVQLRHIHTGRKGDDSLLDDISPNK